MDCKNIKKKFFSRWLFEIIHIIRFEIWDLRSKDLKIFLGHDINYLSIWPFMCHPWFPTRKASKLTFICFQHQVLNTLQGLDNSEVRHYDIRIGTEHRSISRDILLCSVSMFEYLSKAKEVAISVWNFARGAAWTIIMTDRNSPILLISNYGVYNYILHTWYSLMLM